MSSTVEVPRRRTLRDLFHDRRHTALLVAIVAAFAVRPIIGDTGAAPTVFSITMLLLLLVAVYNIQVDELVGERGALLRERRRRSVVAWVLVAPAFVERLLFVLAPRSRWLYLGPISWLAVFAFVSWSELRSVLKQKEVTSETISMAISVYLMIGVTWGVLYIVLFLHDPQSFHFGDSTISSSPDAYVHQNLFPILIYFSLTTLATIGFGDITPVTLPARYAAVAEGITGQFYLAILVARLVAVQMSQRAHPETNSAVPSADSRSPERER